MNGYARCTVPPILVNARPKNNNNNNNNNVIGNSSTSPTAAPTPKRTSEDRDDAKFGGVVSQQPHSSVHHERGQRRKKSVRFTETPDEVVGTAEDIDRSSISAPKRCDVCNVHLVGFVWECGACCEQEKSTKNGSGEDAMSSRGEQHQAPHSPSCQACEELVGVGRMAVREEERVKNTMLEIGPQSPHQSQGTVFNRGNTASSGGEHGFSPSSSNNNNNNNIEDGEEGAGASKKGFRLCVSCYQMHARLSMSRTRFLEERKRKEEENLRKQTISSSSDDTITITTTTTTTTLPAPVLNTTASVPTAEATPEEKENVFSAGQNNSSWLQLAEQLQIHEHDPQNFIRTGLDDQLALEEIIRDRATLMVNGEDRLGRILKEATRRMDAAKRNAAESPENENTNGMHQNEEELAPAL